MNTTFYRDVFICLCFSSREIYDIFKMAHNSLKKKMFNTSGLCIPAGTFKRKQ